jgi:UDP-3-O-[3-hydroxymyristoyl] glucosamine N-acyltransferase
MNLTIRELADAVGGETCGDDTRAISGIAPLEGDVPADHLVWIQNAELLPMAERTGAACILAPSAVTASATSLIRVPNPKLAFAHLLRHCYPESRPTPGIHPSSMVGADVRLGMDVTIGPNAVLGDRVTVGDRVVIGACAVVEQDCRIGDDTVIHPTAMLYRDTQIGQRVTIHASVVIGCDGFGFVMDPNTQRYVKIPQVGNVIIEDEVEISAGTTVDRATIGSTILRRGAKIDNLVQIAHNVIIGEDTAVSAQTGVAGSSTIGDHCVIGGQAGIADHVTVESRAVLAARSGLAPGKVLRSGSVVWGTPAQPIAEVKRQLAAIRRLPELRAEVAALRKALEEAGVPLPEGESRA